MRVLVLLDPPHTLRPKSDTSVAIIDGLLHRGHQVFFAELGSLWLRKDTVGAHVHTIQSASREQAPALTHSPVGESRPLSDFHAVLMRKDPPYDVTYHTATLLLELARGKTLLINDPRGLREANEKLFIFHYPDLIAPTVVTHRMDELKAFMDEQGGEMIVKPLDGYAGLSVFNVRQSDPNTGAILETMTHHGKRWVMAQRKLDVKKKGDKRILLLDGEPLAALLRIPAENELRSNLALGGTARPTELTPREREICERLKPRLRQEGLHLVGIDVIDDHLTEVNVTSPTGVQAANRLYNEHFEERIVDFIETRAPRFS
jgi:glutathione synthase